MFRLALCLLLSSGAAFAQTPVQRDSLIRPELTDSMEFRDKAVQADSMPAIKQGTDSVIPVDDRKPPKSKRK